MVLDYRSTVLAVQFDSRLEDLTRKNNWAFKLVPKVRMDLIDDPGTSVQGLEEQGGKDTYTHACMHGYNPSWSMYTCTLEFVP
eukprot:jgi/Botrbrau1/13953/Bobra.250_1s0007.1